MKAKLGHNEYRNINKKVHDYLKECKTTDREVESAVIVDMVINSIIVKLSA